MYLHESEALALIKGKIAVAKTKLAIAKAPHLIATAVVAKEVKAKTKIAALKAKAAVRTINFTAFEFSKRHHLIISLFFFRLSQRKWL